MKKKKTILLIVVALLFITIVIGGITAYFTKTTETLNNVFTIGSINIVLNEPAWNAANATNLVPGDQVDKDPTVTNTGSNPAYVFVKVTIPNYSNTDLFSLDGIDTTAWQLISETTSNNVCTHVYAYATGNTVAKLTALNPAAAVTLFNDVTLTSNETVAQAASDAGNTTITVTAYAVQTNNVADDANISSQADVYALFSNS